MDKNYIVTKSNALIQANYDLSAHEQKLILTLASLVQPDDTDFKEYVFKVKDFMDLLGVSHKGHYREASKTTKRLMKKVIEIHEGNIIKQFAWLCSATYMFGEGMVTLKFAPELKDHLLFLKSFYTTYKLENILGLKSKYAIRLYEILKCNSYKKIFEFDIDKLKKTLGANASYFKVYADFKKTVLLNPQKEINDKTDIDFEFLEIREWRKIKGIQFTVKPKLNHEFKNQINVDNIICHDLDDTLNLIDRIKETINADFHINALKRLIRDRGIEKIEYYLENWSKFDCIHKKNIAGFFYKAVMREYSPPQQSNAKPIQTTNYEQRTYDDDYYESLYWQPEHDE